MQQPNVIISQKRVTPRLVSMVLGKEFDPLPIKKVRSTQTEADAAEFNALKLYLGEDFDPSPIDDFESSGFEVSEVKFNDLQLHQEGAFIQSPGEEVSNNDTASKELQLYHGETFNTSSIEEAASSYIEDKEPELYHGESSDTISLTRVGSNGLNNNVVESNELQLYQPRTFFPSYRALGTPPRYTEAIKRRARRAGVDLDTTNYQGSISKFELENARLDDSQNCGLFLTHIHPVVLNNLNELFSLINHGKVFSFHLNPPEQGHFSCAAKLSFMTRHSAELLWDEAHSREGIRIRGMRIIACWNREKVRPIASMAAKSRVVCFGGPDLSFYYLESILQSHRFYALVTWSYWTQWGFHGLEMVIEMNFTSVRGQSQMAMACFNAYFNGDARYSAWYAPDPCGL